MALMSIYSDSPTFSYELGKNPATGIQHRKVREGTGFGWFNDDTDVYNLYFKEGYLTQSFAKYDFNYLTQLDCSSPFAYSTLITQFFKETLNKPIEERQPGEMSVTLEQVWYRGKSTMAHLQGQMSDFNIEVTELDGDCLYKLVVTADEVTVDTMLKFICVLTLFLSNKDQRNISKLNLDFVERYAQYFNDFDVPYFIRYMFSRNFFVTPEQFDKYQHLINTENVELSFGDTGQQRASVYTAQLPCLDDVVEIGCGDGKPAEYLFRAGKQIDNYYAVDIDPVELGKFKYRTSKLRTNTEYHTFGHYNDALEAVGSDYCELLLTEVLEHMPYDDALVLLPDVLNKFNWTTAVITVPNREFNKHYLLADDEFRHDDHDWEPDMDEFEDFIFQALDKFDGEFDYEFLPVGDVVDGQSTSLGIRIVNKSLTKRAIICVGASSSGKSTFAAKFEGHYNWLEVNRDNLRFGYNVARDWSNYDFTPQNERKVTAMWNSRMEKGFRLGRNLVISDTNLNTERNDELVKKLQKQGYEVQFKFFDAKFSDLVFRNENRPGGIPYEALLNQWHRYQLMTRPDVAELKDKITKREGVYVPAYCVDLDGTFFNIGQRNGTDTHLCMEDTVNQHVLYLVKGVIAQGITVVFTSGREEKYAEVSNQMIAEALGDDVPRHMWFSKFRKTDDIRRDSLVKIDMVKELCETHFPTIPIAAIDDRKQVIEECWSLLDIPVFNIGKPTERF